MDVDDSLAAAIDETRAALGNDLYIFAPPDETFFLAEALLAAGASIVLRAFFRGFTAAADARLEAWGRNAATWMADRFRAVIDGSTEHGDRQPDQRELIAERQAVASLAEQRAEREVQAYADAAEAAVRDAFTERGLTQAVADEAARKVRAAGMRAIAEM